MTSVIIPKRGRKRPHKEGMYAPLAGSRLSRAVAFIGEWLAPAGCARCGGPLLEHREAWYGLCDDCRRRLALNREPRCSGCGRPLISEIGRCLSCRKGEGRRFDGAFVLYPYGGSYRRLLSAYKFAGRRTLGNFFAEKMREALDFFPPLEAPAWVPVPPRPGKLKERGWDQVDELAKRLEQAHRQRAGAPVCRCLKRLPSKNQKELNRDERKTNLRGRIRPSGPVPRTSILFDDVITTGSTLDACAAALKEGGAEQVYALALFFD